VLVRSQGDPLRLQPEIAAAARSLGAGFAVSDVASMDAELRQELGPQRFDSLLLGLFAAMGLTLAGIGVYAVLAYAVERRRAEIGVRMALGASPAAILRLLAVGALQPVGLGLAVGALASLALGRSLGRFLYGVSPADPATLAAAIGVFLLVALAAVLVPSLRALRVDPNQALRAD
ncbi:MAG TPA: FtsX-like permease family protein, partial [Terriglobales bacterium]|nr:FtsX-like permease family protein [Terriglobales bacterium]